MTYIFQSTKINGLIKKTDKIAMITPIFSPYLEIPLLPEYDLEIVHIYAHEENDWQVTSQELTKLEDSDIKMLCLVNPSNPPSVKMSDDVLNDIAELVNTKRSDLMIVTDDVYANFSDDFESLFSRCPFNTLCVYSFSKYFGCTGWRLGTIALHKDNVFDRLLSNVDNDTKDMLEDRYSSLTSQVSDLKFMDRIVADSRSVVLNHTAGISLPQQLQMVLFALSGLLDNQSMYRNAAKSIIKRRNKLLYQSISRDIRPNYDSSCVGYYAILDIEYLAKELYGERFSKWLIVNCNINDFLKHLASKTGIVLLPGNGFDVEHPSVRVSLANLREFDYKAIGNNIRNQLDDLYGEFEGL